MVARTSAARKTVEARASTCGVRAPCRIRSPASCKGTRQDAFGRGAGLMGRSGSGPTGRRRARGGRVGRPLGGSRRHDGRWKDLRRQAARGQAWTALCRRRRRDRSRRAIDHLRDFRALWRALFPRRRAEGDRASSQRRAAGAGDRRRRVHEPGDARQYRRARRLDLAEAEFRYSARPRAQEVQSAAAEDRRPGSRRCAGSSKSAHRPTRSPISRSNCSTAPTTRSSKQFSGASPRRCARIVGPPGRRKRKVEVPLGARAYSILIGPGLIDEAGLEIAKFAPAR